MPPGWRPQTNAEQANQTVLLSVLPPTVASGRGVPLFWALNKLSAQGMNRRPTGSQRAYGGRPAEHLPPADTRVDPLIARDLEQRLRRHVESLDYIRHPISNPTGLEAACTYLRTCLAELGFEVRLQLVTSYPMPQYNLLARKSGDSSSRKIVVEAHYDTVFDSQGADDNASGLAGLLEIARLVGPRSGVELASFCLEEDRLRGAATYVGELRETESPEFIDLEMIGYTSIGLTAQVIPIKVGGRKVEVPLPGTGGTITIVGNWPSRRLTRALMRACLRNGQPAVPLALPFLSSLIPDVRRSDHFHFWKRGLQAVMITDMANFRNPNYHKPSDRPDTLDYPFMGRVTRAVAAYLCRPR